MWTSHVTHMHFIRRGHGHADTSRTPLKEGGVWYKHDVLKRGVRVHAMAYTPLQQTLCDVFVDAHENIFHMCDITHSFIRVTWLVHMCGMTRWYVWHDSFISVTWLIRVCTWLVYKCDMAHSCVWRDLFMGVATLIHRDAVMTIVNITLYMTQRCV